MEGSSIGAECEGIELCPAAISESHTQADARSSSQLGCCVYPDVRKDTFIHNNLFLLLLVKGESEPPAVFSNPAAFIETSRKWLESAAGAEGQSGLSSSSQTPPPKQQVRTMSRSKV